MVIYLVVDPDTAAVLPAEVVENDDGTVTLVAELV